jgi:hypothetical protein
MKLAEAMVGQDLLGFNKKSVFRRDGRDFADTINLYPSNPGTGDAVAYAKYVDEIKSRRMYLQLEKANAYQIKDIYSSTHLTGSTAYPATPDPCYMVLCDAYVRTMATGNKLGMPILYYRADTNKNEHDANEATDCTTPNNNIYNRCDNQELVDIPLPWVTSATLPVHPMATTGSGLTLTGAPA